MVQSLSELTSGQWMFIVGIWLIMFATVFIFFFIFSKGRDGEVKNNGIRKGKGETESGKEVG